MELPPKPSRLSKYKSAAAAPTSGSGSLEELLPPGKGTQTSEEAKPAPPAQVFQGKQMREDASWYERALFSYAQPLLYSSMKEQITFDQYGVMPEHLKIKYEVAKLEANIDYYVKKDTKDTNGVIKGVAATMKERLAAFLLAKVVLCVCGISVPVLMAKFVEYVENDANIGDNSAWLSAITIACQLLAIKGFSQIFWEHVCYYMIETGHKSHTSLKTVMFKKALRMSPATNKDYSSGEVLNLIERDCNRVWSCIWDVPACFEIPFELVVATYYIYSYVGFSALSGLTLYGITFALQKYQSKMNETARKKIDKQKDERMMKTSEGFNHAQNLKLYGWEQKFGDKISEIYNEEMRLHTRKMSFNGFNECFQELIENFLPLVVFSVYVYMGNTMTMSQIVLTTIMLQKVKNNCRHLTHI